MGSLKGANRYRVLIPTLSSIGYPYRRPKEKREAREWLCQHLGREIGSLTELSDDEIGAIVAYVRFESGEYEYGT